jgi:hypothetical protein
VEPTIIIGLATGSVTLLRATGVLKTSADVITAETRDDVKALLRTHYNAGLGELELAGSTDLPDGRRRALHDAAGHLRLAASQDRLAPHFRGFAAAVLASLSWRDGDLGAARHWAAKATHHYDHAFRGLDRAAQRSVDALRRGRGWGKGGAAVVLGVMSPAAMLLGPLGAPVAARKMAEQATRKLPSDRWISELIAQAGAVHVLAHELEVVVDDPAIGIQIERHGRVIVRSELVMAGSLPDAPFADEQDS